MKREKRIPRERRKYADKSNSQNAKEFTREDWIEMMSEAYYQAMKRVRADEAKMK